MSLLKFIMPEMLEKSSSSLTKIFQLSNSESDFARQRALEAKAILDPFVMRRIKVKNLQTFLFHFIRLGSKFSTAKSYRNNIIYSDERPSHNNSTVPCS